MIVIKDELLNKTQTRYEILEERILKIENNIKNICKDVNLEGMKEIEKLNSVLNELEDFKDKIKNIQETETINLEKESKIILNDSLLILNNDKIRIINVNENLIREKREKDCVINKLLEEIKILSEEKKQTNRSHQEFIKDNNALEEKLKSLQSRAYGYDIAKKFEMYQNKLNNERESIVVKANKFNSLDSEQMAYNFWEKESNGNSKHLTKLEDLTKQKDLWIGNPFSNVDKFMKEDKTFSQPSMESNGRRNPPLQTNMRKISGMILDNKK